MGSWEQVSILAQYLLPDGVGVGVLVGVGVPVRGGVGVPVPVGVGVPEGERFELI